MALVQTLMVHGNLPQRSVTPLVFGIDFRYLKEKNKLFQVSQPWLHGCLARQEDVEAVFCCVGGGGLLAGVASFLKAVKPDIKVRNWMWNKEHGIIWNHMESSIPGSSRYVKFLPFGRFFR